jgi:hypothetical protein
VCVCVCVHVCVCIARFAKPKGLARNGEPKVPSSDCAVFESGARECPRVPAKVQHNLLIGWVWAGGQMGRKR